MQIEKTVHVLLGLTLALAAGYASGGPMEDPPGRAESVRLESPQVTVPMTLVDNRPVVEVRINGKGPFPFILDTAAHGPVVAQSLVDDLGLPVTGESELHSPGPGRHVPAKLVRIDRLEMGGAVAEGLTAASMDFASLFRSPTAPRGILSPMVFSGLLLTIDYPKGEVVVRSGELPAPDGSEVLDAASEDGLSMIPLTVAGRPVKAHLDSGSPAGLSLPKSMAADLPLVAPPVETHRARTVDKEFVILGATLKGEVRMGRFTFENMDLSFTDLPNGNVGFDLLRRYAVTLDVKNRRVRLEEGQVAAAPAPPRRRYGMRMLPSASGDLTVAGTDPGSPAEKAGLLPGDRIVGVNGKLVADLSPDQLADLLHATPVSLVVERQGAKLEISMKLD